MSIVKLTKENYDAEVVHSEKPVLIDFWAEWCGPCKMLSPVVDEIAAENKEVKVCKINIDEQPELARTFQVMSIPMLMFIKDGELLKKSVGVKPKTTIMDMITV